MQKTKFVGLALVAVLTLGLVSTPSRAVDVKVNTRRAMKYVLDPSVALSLATLP